MIGLKTKTNQTRLIIMNSKPKKKKKFSFSNYKLLKTVFSDFFHLTASLICYALSAMHCLLCIICYCYVLSAMLYLLSFLRYALSAIPNLLCFICCVLAAMNSDWVHGASLHRVSDCTAKLLYICYA